MPKALQNVVGQKYNMLTIIQREPRSASGQYLVSCLCDCGKKKVMYLSGVRSGHSKSCGCLSIQTRFNESDRTHGLSKTREYNIWCGIKDRCSRAAAPGYENYGGRGISVCAEWSNDFAAFLAHVGNCPSSNHQIDRINNNKGYEPGNVRWATRSEQNRNCRRNVILTFNGASMTAQEWSEKTGIKPASIRYRKHNGWTDAQALEFESK